MFHFVKASMRPYYISHLVSDHGICMQLTWLRSDIKKSMRAPGKPSSRYVFTNRRSALLPKEMRGFIKTVFHIFAIFFFYIHNQMCVRV